MRQPAKYLLTLARTDSFHLRCPVANHPRRRNAPRLGRRAPRDRRPRVGQRGQRVDAVRSGHQWLRDRGPPHAPQARAQPVHRGGREQLTGALVDLVALGTLPPSLVTLLQRAQLGGVFNNVEGCIWGTLIGY